MYTVVLFALAGFTSSTEIAETPAWLSDYAQARQQGMADKKPVAVVVGSGKEGWEKLVRNGALDKEQNKLLASGYVCVYVDVTTEPGKRVASSLEVNGRGLVISDITGKVMALHHQGDILGADLTKHLRKFADPERVVRATESNAVSAPQSRTSYYQQPAAQPAYNFAPSVPSGGRSC